VGQKNSEHARAIFVPAQTHQIILVMAGLDPATQGYALNRQITLRAFAASRESLLSAENLTRSREDAKQRLRP
jgi:hypothetical protein